MSEKSLEEILDAVEESPLTGTGGPQGKVDWDAVVEKFITEEGEGNKYFTVSDIMNYIIEDLGTDIKYSSCHSWLRRLDKKDEYNVIKKMHGKNAYYLITAVEAPAEE